MNRQLKAYIGLAHAACTRPGLPLEHLAESHREGLDFLRECSADLCDIGVLRKAGTTHSIQPREPGWNPHGLVPTQLTRIALNDAAGRAVKGKRRYSLSIALENLITSRLHLLDQQSEDSTPA